MGDCIYVVADGEIEIVRELASGGEEVLKVAGPGDYFGEMGPVFGLPRSATVRALTAATVIGYTVQAFREKLGATGSGRSSSTARWVATGAPARNQTEQQVGTDPLDTVVAPAQRAGDGGHSHVVDGHDRSAEQDGPDVGQDPVDRPGPQERPGQGGTASMRMSVRSDGARSTSSGSCVLITMVRESSLADIGFRCDLTPADDDAQRLVLGEHPPGSRAVRVGLSANTVRCPPRWRRRRPAGGARRRGRPRR